MPTAKSPRMDVLTSAVMRGTSARFRKGTPVKVREKFVASPLFVMFDLGTTFRCPLLAWGSATKIVSMFAPDQATLRLGVPHISSESGLHVVNSP